MGHRILGIGMSLVAMSYCQT